MTIENEQIDPASMTTEQYLAHRRATATFDNPMSSKVEEVVEDPTLEVEQTEQVDPLAQLEDVQALEQQVEDQEAVEEEKKSGFQRRVDKLNKRITDKEAEAAYWREVALKNQQIASPEYTQMQQPVGKPVLAQYNNDYEAYTEALTDWKVQQALAQQQQMQQQHQVASTYHNRVQEFIKQTPDFADVMADASDVHAEPEILQAVIDSDIGPKIAYYLAKNPREVERINSLPSHRRLVEMGKLEDRLSVKATTAAVQQKQPSKAPVPARPASGGTPVVSTKAPHEMTPQEYIAYRNKTAGRR